MQQHAHYRVALLERRNELALRDNELPLRLGHGDLKVAIHTVGVCGSDVHYYTHGRIGPYVLYSPMYWVMRRPEPL